MSADGTRPLAGRRIIITRARHQAAVLADGLEALGAEVIVAPVIETVDPPDFRTVDDAIGALETYHWIVFTSANAVDRFFARLHERGHDARALAGILFAVVGTATADRLRSHGIEPDLVPDGFHAEGVLEALCERGVGRGSRVLVPRALHAREILPEALRQRGAHVTVAPVYMTVPVQLEHSVIERLAAGDVDAVTFTSPSTLRHFLAHVERAGLDAHATMESLTVASIGPVTTAALEERGLHADVEPRESTVPALVSALAEYLAV